MSAYQTKIENWHSAAIEQLEIDFNEKMSAIIGPNERQQTTRNRNYFEQFKPVL
jgi:predicted ATP-dependent endonuclease of OLD family